MDYLKVATIALASYLAAIPSAYSQELTHDKVLYGEGREVLDIYSANRDTPSPVYIWGHAKGMNYKMIPKNTVKECQRLGITFISIEANDIGDVVGSELRHSEPWNKALDFVIANAEKYNFDEENIFIGGRSLGSIGSFPVAMKRWQEIRALYSMQAIPKRGQENVPFVHKDSPPCFFIFKTAPGSKNHDPLHGMMIGDAYQKYGIGNRFTIKTEVEPKHWFDWFFEFIETNIQESGIEDLDPTRFAGAIRRFEKLDAESPSPKGGTVVVGSSSVRRLDAERVLPGVQIIQRGFGGAHISDINHYIQQTVLKHEPSKVIFFCGGNDLWRGHSVKEVREEFEEFTKRLFERRPECKLYVLALRPSPKREKIIHRILRMNRALEEIAKSNPRITFLRDSCDRFLDQHGLPIASLYVEDNQHMNEKGYKVWTNALMPYLSNKK